MLCYNSKFVICRYLDYSQKSRVLLFLVERLHREFQFRPKELVRCLPVFCDAIDHSAISNIIAK